MITDAAATSIRPATDIAVRPPAPSATPYGLAMAEERDAEARLRAVEHKVDTAAADAAAARHLAAARDRDLAEVTLKVDANRAAINALGVQTAARFDRLEQRFDRFERRVENGFTEIRGRLDAAAAGQQQIVELLTTVIERDGET